MGSIKCSMKYHFQMFEGTTCSTEGRLDSPSCNSESVWVGKLTHDSYNK